MEDTIHLNEKNLHMRIKDIERELLRTCKIDGLLPRLSQLENLDIMTDPEECLLDKATNTDKDLPITHLPQTTMIHHHNIEGTAHLMNHKEGERRENMNTKKAALVTEEEQDTTNIKDK